MRIDGHLLIGTTLMSGSDLHGGLEQLDRAIALFPDVPTAIRSARVGNDSRVSCLTTAGFTLWILGLPDQAVARADAALALAAELDHPFTTAYARFHAGMLRLWRREPAIALELATGLLELADEHEFRIWTAAGTCLRGAAQVDLGRPEEGLANVRAGMGLYGELRSPPIFWPFLLMVQARACAAGGQPAEGLRAVDASMEILGAGDGASMVPELRLIKGDLHLALEGETGGGSAEAERWYRLAFDRAGVLGARTAQLRAATRLARLRLADGDAAAARAVLGPVHATFAEGLDTADLVEARDVLAAAGGRRDSPTP